MKRILSFILAAFMLLALASCGGKEEADTTAAAQTGEITETESAVQTEPERDAEKDYAEAVRLYDSGDIESAYKLLYTLKGYRDADEYLATIGTYPEKVTVTVENASYEPENGVYTLERKAETDEAGRLSYLAVTGDDVYTHYDRRTTYEYDEAGRLARTRTTNSAGEETGFRNNAYDGEGRLVRTEYFPVKSIVEGDVGWNEYEYDEAGNVTKFTFHGYLGTFERTYTYDERGNCLTVRGFFGENDITGNDYEYDEAGRITKSYVYMGQERQEPTEYFYDDAGLLVRSVWSDYDGENHETVYPRDGKGRLLSEPWNGGKIVYEYTDTEEGSKTRKTYYSDNEVSWTREYHYDRYGLLIFEKDTSAYDGEVETTEYSGGYYFAVFIDPDPDLDFYPPN